MAVLVGVKIPDQERVVIGLTRIYGVGLTTSKKITEELNIPAQRRVSELSSEDIARIRSVIERNRILVEGDLRRETEMNIRRLRDVQCYRGLRHRKHLPVRGQRTKTNARTKRGKRQTVAGKKRVKSH